MHFVLIFFVICVHLVLEALMHPHTCHHYSGADSMTPFLVISISQSLNVTLIRITNLNTLYMTDLFACRNICTPLQAFSPLMLHGKRVDGLTTGCDGKSLTDALHFWCFIIFLKSMQSRRFAPLFASLWRHRLERLFSGCNIDWLKVPRTMCSISRGVRSSL